MDFNVLSTTQQNCRFQKHTSVRKCPSRPRRRSILASCLSMYSGTLFCFFVFCFFCFCCCCFRCGCCVCVCVCAARTCIFLVNFCNSYMLSVHLLLRQNVSEIKIFINECPVGRIQSGLRLINPCICNWIVKSRWIFKPDYRKNLSPEILCIPYKWFVPGIPLKKIKKIREKIPSKGHLRARTLVEFKEKFPDQFFTICK